MTLSINVEFLRMIYFCVGIAYVVSRNFCWVDLEGVFAVAYIHNFQCLNE